MKVRKDVVSAFEAKTHLSELLRETEQGRSYTIERRGKPVARLVPVTTKGSKEDLAELWKIADTIRRKVRGRVRVRDLIEEGRRF